MRLSTLSLLVALLALAPGAFAQTNQTIAPGQTGQTLLNTLDQDYSPSSTLSYNGARDLLYGDIDKAPNDSLYGVYSQFAVFIGNSSTPRSTAFQNGAGINAEHVFPQSKGAEGAAKSDMHNLHPTRVDVNGDRGSLPFGEVDNSSASNWYYHAIDRSSQPPLSSIDLYSERNSGLFEPREDFKGDIARAVFYFYSVWPDKVAANGGESFFQGMKSTLVTWHENDPVTVAEQTRSARIAQSQGTENPFMLDNTLASRAFGDGTGGTPGDGDGSEPGDGGGGTDPGDGGTDPGTGSNPDGVIAFQGFESTAADTWPIVADGGNISSNTGAGETPNNARIRTGSNSWQNIGETQTLQLGAVDVSGFTDVQVVVYVSSTSATAGNGAETGDSVELDVALDGVFGNPDLTITGNAGNNSRWPYTEVEARTAAGSPVVVAANGAGDTDGPSRLVITIPSGTQTVALDIQASNNSGNERWNIDDVQVLGTAAAASPTVAFTTATFSETEGDSGTVTGTVTASITDADPATPTTVDVVVTGGTADGSDFAFATTTLTFPAGATDGTTQSASVTINGDTDVEPSETILFALQNVSAGSQIGDQDTATFTIANDDFATRVAFSAEAQTIAENAGPAVLTLQIAEEDVDNDTQVLVEVTGGTAVEGEDYTFTPQTVTFDDSGDDRTVSVTILDEATFEGDETIEFTLSIAQGNTNPNAAIGTPGALVLTLTNDDAGAGQTLSVNGEGWRLLASPSETETFDGALGPFFTQCFEGSDYDRPPCDSPGFAPNVLRWNGSAYEEISNQSNIMGSGTGFFWFVFSDDNLDGTPEGFPKTVRASGAEPQNDVEVTLTPGTGSVTLAGNPFDQAIEVGALEPNGIGEIQDEVQVWNPATQQYVGLSGVLGDVVEVWQGFFVENSANPLRVPDDGHDPDDGADGSGGHVLRSPGERRDPPAGTAHRR